MTTEAAPADVAARPGNGFNRAGFVAAIMGVCQDNGARAELRRTLGQPPELARTAHRYVVPRLPVPEPGQPRTAEDFTREKVAYTMAAIVATVADRPETIRGGASLGKVLAPVLGRNDRGEPRDDRLHLIARATLDDLLYRHLPGLLARCKNERQVPDLVLLFGHLMRWPYDQDRVTRAWFADFYRATSASTAGSTDTTDAPPAD